MKLIILITALSLQVSAAVYGQQVTINYTNAPLREVMTAVRKQSGYNFLFQSEYLKNAKPVTIHLNNASIEKTLQSIFQDQPFNYKIDGKIISIRPKEKDKSFIEKVKDFFFVITFKGKVTDEDGIPLPGATVRAGNKATLTNTSGEFSLSGVEENADVEVSYIGYAPVTVKASSVYLTVRLMRKAGELEEVKINKGYYSTTKELNTGNVSLVRGEDLRKNNTGDPLIALQGQVPGLFIAQTSGIPGSQVNVKLRGQNSLRGDANDPLYIVDGVPFPATSLTQGTVLAGAGGNLSPLANISLNDIEKIEVLKDADATAIYGSRGANGVILITTKKGVEGKTRVDVNFNSGIGKVSNTLNLMGTEQYLAMRNQAFENDGVAPSTSDYDVNGKWGNIHQYTDWQKVLIGGTSHITNANASVSGGNTQTQFIFGGAYRKEGTVFPGDYRDLKTSGHASITHESENKRFHSSVSINYLDDNNRLPAFDFTQNILLAPNTPAIYNPDGTLNWQNSTWLNPLWYTTQKATSITDNLNTALNLSYEIVKGLSVNTRMGYTDIRSNSSNINPFTGYDPAVTVNPNQRRNIYGNTRVKTWIAEPSINYTTKLGGGILESLVGGTLQQNEQTSIYQAALGFSSPALVENVAAATTQRVLKYTNVRYRYSALYARVGYNYHDQYLINFTARKDASSRFGPGKQIANFGAVGGAWVFSKQDAIKDNLSFLSFGKLRASYGITGNDQILDYKFLSTYTSNGLGYQGVAGLNPTGLTNPNYGWETVKKLEVGLDLGFAKDRILFNVSWYQNRTGNQLVGYSLPDITGFSNIQANLPAVIQNRGTEFELVTHNISSKNFTWTTSANLSIPRNKLLSYPNLANSSYASTYVEGMPLSVAFLYHYTGIDPVTKQYTFEDGNKDGQITYGVDMKPVFVGQKYYGGINNSFTYQDFQLDFFLQFVKQNGYSFISNLPPGVFGDSANQLASIVQTKDGLSGSEHFTQDFGSNLTSAWSNYYQSDGRLIDASFIRLKNISLGWNLPGNYLRFLKLRNAKIYLQGQNIFTITKYKGLDPEFSYSNSSLPPLRIIMAGIQLSL